MSKTLVKNTRSHCKPEMWKQAMDPTRTIYKEAANFPAAMDKGGTVYVLDMGKPVYTEDVHHHGDER